METGNFSGFAVAPHVQKFSAEGTYVSQFGTKGSEPGQLSKPQGIAISSAGNLYLADTANNRVQEFKASGELIRAFGKEGSGNGELKKPAGLGFDAEGALWVADTANNRLQRFSSAGTYLAQLGTAGNDNGQLSEPKGLAVDGSGDVWVADTANNRVQELAWATATTTYTYDQAGELTGVQRPAAGSLPAINQTLAYDATGLLASKTTGSTTRYLAWDASTALPLLLNDGESSYLYGPGGLPIEQINSKGEPTYLHHDQLGTTRLLTSSSGTTSASFTYAPYGALEAKTGTATTPLGFTGQYTDAESGLQYLRARFYDPATGQFMSKDPLAAITWDSYSYGSSNPMRYIDPSGLCGVSSPGAVVESINPFSEDNCAFQGANMIPNSLMEPAVNASAGFGDQASFGLTRDIRKRLGINGSVDECSPWYKGGGVAATVDEALLFYKLYPGAMTLGNEWAERFAVRYPRLYSWILKKASEAGQRPSVVTIIREILERHPPH